MVNAPERVEVSNKTTQVPSIMKRGRVATGKKDNAPSKRTRKEKRRHLQKIVNVGQSVVDRYPVDNNIPQSSTQARYINENASMSKNLDDLILGNHVTSKGMQEISSNYTSSEEVYDRRTIIANSCFLTIIDENALADPDRKTTPQCKRRPVWNKCKEAIEVELNSLKK
jgi:hypothetical protein